MRPENVARAGPAVDAVHGPQIERLPDRLDILNSSLSAAKQRNAGLILGVDIGIAGALAFLTREGDLLDVHDMPTLADGPAGRRSVNAALLAEIIFKSHAMTAYVEFVGPRPAEGAVGAFAFGRARGVVEGVLAAGHVPVTFLTAPAWKRLIGIPPGKVGAKDAARSEAIRRWPSHAGLFARVKDDGRAEAGLIAVAGLMREARR